MTDWAAYEQEALAALAAAEDLDALAEAQVRFLGRRSDLKQALRGVRDRDTGRTLNAARERLEAAAERRRAELERAQREAAVEETVDVTLPGLEFRRGSLHPITQIRREVEDIFLGLGYEVVDGREVETVHYIFDQLNMGPGHVTRSPLHTFYLTDNTLLRTETSASQ